MNDRFVISATARQLLDVFDAKIRRKGAKERKGGRKFASVSPFFRKGRYLF
jgi:hypothetical protein